MIQKSTISFYSVKFTSLRLHSCFTNLILLIYLSLNFHVCRHIGHSCWLSCEFSHLIMQWIWKTWEQFPHTKGQLSPGNVQSGQQDSKAMRQIPQLSSFAIHFQTATPVQPTNDNSVQLKLKKDFETLRKPKKTSVKKSEKNQYLKTWFAFCKYFDIFIIFGL